MKWLRRAKLIFPCGCKSGVGGSPKIKTSQSLDKEGGNNLKDLSTIFQQIILFASFAPSFIPLYAKAMVRHGPCMFLKVSSVYLFGCEHPVYRFQGGLKDGEEREGD